MEVGHARILFFGMIHWHFLLNLDLHTRHLAFTLPGIDSVPEENFIEMLGKPGIGHV